MNVKVSREEELITRIEVILEAEIDDLMKSYTTREKVYDAILKAYIDANKDRIANIVESELKQGNFTQAMAYAVVKSFGD